MVTVIIPNYNGLKFLKDCLQGLEKQSYKEFKVIVIDNGSDDGSVNFLKEEKGIELIALEKNIGFCGAVNLGIKSANTKYVILLNNDTIVYPKYIEMLVKHMQEKDDVFSTSAQMIKMHDESLIDNAGDLYCALGWAFARGTGKKNEKYSKEHEVFSSCGGAAIYRREIFQEIGYFDEAHFAYLEDVDIGYRARIFGYHNEYEPEAKVLHYGSGFSGSKHNEFKVKLASKNSIFLIWKNMPFLQIIINLPFLVVGFLVKTVFFTKKGLGSVYIKGLKQGFRMCLDENNKNHKVKFKKKHFKNYLNIQWLLWKNLFNLGR